MRKNFLTVEFVKRKMDIENRDTYGFYNKYFKGKKGTQEEPTQEVAELFFRYMVGYSEDSYEIFNFLEEGYITFKRILEIDYSHFIVNNTSRVLFSLFHSDEMIPINKEEMDSCFKLIKEKDREKIAVRLLTLSIQITSFSGGDSPKKKLRDNFIKTIDGCLEGLLSNIDVMDKVSWVWRKCSYLPTKVIVKRLNESDFTKEAFKKFVYLLEDRSTYASTHLGQAIELLEIFNNSIYLSGSTVYSKDGGSSFLIRALGESSEELAAADPKIKLTVYNSLIKPLIKNHNLIEESFKKFDKSHIGRRLFQISAAVVPTTELVGFIKTILFQIGVKYDLCTCYSIVENISRFKNETDQMVTEEFILMQLEYRIQGNRMCLNNKCIGKLEFWIEKEETLKRYPYIFDHGLQYNKSFLRWFKITKEEIPLYETQKDFIRWTSINSLPVIPLEFIQRFYKYLKIYYLSNEVIASLREEEISLYLDYEKESRVPFSLLRDNKNMSLPFIIKNMEQLFYDRESLGNCGELKLADMINELE